MTTDSYMTLAEPAEGVFKDRGSKFLAYVFPLDDMSDIDPLLSRLRKEHVKARHHCYAWRLGTDGSLYRTNDDGEPSGTAGRPILGQIDHFGLTNVLAVVVRYFGGTLLGTSGLIQAYHESTADAFARATLIRKRVTQPVTIRFDYIHMNAVMQAIKQYPAEIARQDFGELPEIEVNIPLTETEDFLLRLRAQVLQVTLEEARTISRIHGLQIIG